MNENLKKRQSMVVAIRNVCAVALFALSLVAGASPAEQPSSDSTPSAPQHRSDAATGPRADLRDKRQTMLIGVGDSLTHGTMDATNNDVNTLHAYMQLLADSLAQTTRIRFTQPLFDLEGERIAPKDIPTNLGVDGADIFSVEGIEYYKRVAVRRSFVTDDYLCDVRVARRLDDKYDRVLYPINLEKRAPVSQIDSAIWLVNEYAGRRSRSKAVVMFWAGNNDSSAAALGSGGDNPLFIPVPAAQIRSEVTPLVRSLLRFGEDHGLISFDAYTQATIERNLTELDDFSEQYNHLLDRLDDETGRALTAGRMEVFLLTLPYYSSVGYLMDSEDIEFYLRQLNRRYSVPPTFARVAPEGQPIADPTQGDRISLFTFGLMYLLLNWRHSIHEVNQVLEMHGRQRDDMVLSEAEQAFIAGRIDGFNAVIIEAAAHRGRHVHLVDVGRYLNNTLTGVTPVVINGRPVTRKWTRGGAFTLDGVHPGYAGQAHIANYIINQLNARLELDAPLYDLDVLARRDPYWDQDGDGWAPGPDYPVSGLASMLFFLTDSDDADPEVTTDLPRNVWEQMSEAILKDLLGIPAMRAEAQRLGADITGY